MTPAEAAKAMLAKLRSDGFLYQETAAADLAELQNENLAYYDGGGNLCVGKGVLREFRKLTEGYVYERSGKFWRERLETDVEGRQQ